MISWEYHGDNHGFVGTELSDRAILKHIVLTPTNVDSRPCPELEVGSSPSSWDEGGWYLCTILCCCIYIVSGKMAYIYIVKNGYFYCLRPW